MTIGERIKQARLDNNLSRMKLGDMIGRTASSIQKYETGEHSTSVEILMDISKALDVPIDSLIGISSDDDTVNFIRKHNLHHLTDEQIKQLHHDLEITTEVILHKYRKKT